MAFLENELLTIAELSGNHDGSLSQALKLIDSLSESGVKAIKLQTYTADTITLDCNQEDFVIKDRDSLWYGYNLYQLYHKAHTPWEWHKEIFDKCKKLNIVCFSSPFDETAVDFLETLNCPCYKIASFEITHLPLIKKVASTGKPVIISTGMASLLEISEAYETAKKYGASQVAILKCTSSYPADASDANIATIEDLQEKFPDAIIGLSDHSLGIGVAIASIAKGARIIEKHVTLDRSNGAVDSAFSLEPHEFKLLCEEGDRALKSIGKVKYAPGENEKNSLKFRRSIYISENVKKGDVIAEDNIKIIRPSYGLEPKLYEDIIGKKFNDNFLKGTALKKQYISDD